MSKTIERTKKLVEFDQQFGDKVAGVDEAGRGPIAGPLVCAACIMPTNLIIDGIFDSKKVTPKKREELFEKITKEAISYSIQVISIETIEKINILNAVKLGMKNAIAGLLVKPGHIIIDAESLQLSIPNTIVIKADEKSYCVAAASILAKVYRDNLMSEYCKQFPLYGFSSHKGYGTSAHYQAIKEHGACSIHRKSWIK